MLLKDASILVLDEATSALDSESEAAIQEKPNLVMEGKTVIATTHRLSTVISGSRRWISAADAKARQAGVRVRMPAAKAQVMVHGLRFADADPAAGAEALQRIAPWSLSQYSPIVAVDGTDGIVMDTDGAGPWTEF